MQSRDLCWEEWPGLSGDIVETKQTSTRMGGRSEKPTCVWNQQLERQDQKLMDAASDRNGKVQKQFSLELPGELSAKTQLEPTFIIFLVAATKHLTNAT